MSAASRYNLKPENALSLQIASVATQDVLNASLFLKWIEINNEGFLSLTARGENILRAGDDLHKLRLLVIDYVEIDKPSWLQLAPSGRLETLLQAPSGIKQIIVEAGLAYGLDPDTISFWDALAARARGSRDVSLSEIGRRGERLTIEWELERTGSTPKWVAVDSSAAGYDVLSQISDTDRRRLTIEVKASTRPPTHAKFHLTRNEWDAAQDCLFHTFHIWDLSATPPMLAVLSLEQMSAHIPTDAGQGLWELAEISFRAFEGEFRSAPLGAIQ